MTFFQSCYLGYMLRSILRRQITTAAQFAQSNPIPPPRPVLQQRPAAVIEYVRNPFERPANRDAQPARIFDLAWSSRQ